MIRSNWTFNHESEKDAHEFYKSLNDLLFPGELQDYRVFPVDHPLRDDPRYKKLIRQLKEIKEELKNLENE